MGPNRRWREDEGCNKPEKFCVFESTSVLNAVSTRTELKVRSDQGSIVYILPTYLSLSLYGMAIGGGRLGGRGGGG